MNPSAIRRLSLRLSAGVGVGVVVGPWVPWPGDSALVVLVLLLLASVAAFVLALHGWERRAWGASALALFVAAAVPLGYVHLMLLKK